jgi:hypothetical protein
MLVVFALCGCGGAPPTSSATAARGARATHGRPVESPPSPLGALAIAGTLGCEVNCARRVPDSGRERAAASEGPAHDAAGGDGGVVERVITRSLANPESSPPVCGPSVDPCGFDAGAVRATLQARIRALSGCWERCVRCRHAGQLGALRLTLEPSGRVSRVGLVVVAGELDAEISACLSGVVRATQFPPFSGSALELMVPLTFGTQSGS